MSTTLVHHWLESNARHRPDAPALIESTRETTYAELDRQADRFANLYRELGVVRGDRVVLGLGNGLDMVAAYFGALKAGAIAVPLPGGAKSDRLVAAVIDCAPRVAVVDDGAARLLAALPAGHGPVVLTSGSRSATHGPGDLHAALSRHVEASVAVEATEDDLAAIIYTSGSTGEPRGVRLSHRNFVANARSIVSYLRLTEADRAMCVLPFHYVYGLSLLHTHFAVGGSVMVENRSAFPNVVLASMQQHRVTGFAGVPSTFTLLLHRSNLAGAELPTLRYVTQAGGGMAPAQVLEWLEVGPKAEFYVMYGATEAAARLTYLPPADLRRKLGSIGRAIPGVDIAVRTESGATAAPGEIGELIARGDNISSGYWNNPEETSRRFSALGYHTGDLGYADDEGFLFLVGRTHDMIKVGANRVGPKEIEDVLHDHPAVHEAAVVGAEHAMLGEAPVAFVSLNRQLQDAETTLRGHCADRLLPYKVPVHVIVMQELPKLAGSGKVDRRWLREQLAAGAAAPAVFGVTAPAANLRP